MNFSNYGREEIELAVAMVANGLRGVRRLGNREIEEIDGGD